MEKREWKRMPETFGPYWFCKDLKDRDLAELVRVSQILAGGDERPHFEIHGGERSCTRLHDTVITPDMGWWLLILDERKTATVAAPG